MTPLPDLKQCSKCREVKPRTEFYKKAAAQDGGREWCKACTKADRASHKRVCAIDDCEKPVLARGWCNAHYRRWRSHGDPLKMVIVRHTGCSVEGCDRPHYMKTYCLMHHRRVEMNGDPGGVESQLQSREGSCEVDGCQEDVWAKGMCVAHYGLKRRNGSPDTRVRNRRKAADIPEVCEIEGCNKPYKMNGYCQMHAFRVREHGDPGPAEVMLQPQKGKACKVPDCDRPAKSRNKCARHFRLELRHENPERAREEVLRRRARQNENGMLTVTKKDLARLYASPCAECGATGKVEADHIIPVANPFGRTSIGNLQPLCRSCNSSKSDDLMVVWRTRKARQVRRNEAA